LTYIFRSLRQNNFGRALDDLRRVRVYGTSMSAYRKLHSLITSILDKIVELKPDDPNINVLANILSELTSTTLLVQYQKERGLLSRDIADGLYNILVELIREIERYYAYPNKTDATARKYFDNIRSIARAIKIIIDGIVAFNYKKFKH